MDVCIETSDHHEIRVENAHDTETELSPISVAVVNCALGTDDLRVVLTEDDREIDSVALYSVPAYALDEPFVEDHVHVDEKQQRVNGEELRSNLKGLRPRELTARLDQPDVVVLVSEKSSIIRMGRTEPLGFEERFSRLRSSDFVALG